MVPAIFPQNTNAGGIPLPPGMLQDAKGLGALFSRQEYDSELFDESDLDADLLERASVTSAANGGDLAWTDVTKAMMRSSCAFFAQEVLQGPPEAPYNGRFFVANHHLDWDRLIDQSKRLMVLSPRDSGKSFFFDFAYPIWRAVHQPGGKGFIFSATKDQAVRILQDIKDELETNPNLNWLVPTRKTGGRWAATMVQLTNGHRIYARGFGTKVRGAHPNWIVADDVLNDETAYSELVRKKQIDYFFSAISQMVVPGGQIIVVGTPLHVSDLYGQLSQNPEYLFRRYQALNGPDENPLWPERYSREDLYAKRREIGPIRFTREMQCNPVGDDMSLFPGYLFEGPLVEYDTLTLGMSKDFWEDKGISIFMGVDFALSSSVSADYTVIWVMGLDRHGNRWIIDIIRGKGIPYHRQLAKIKAVGRKYEPAMVFVEANQAQRIFGDELVRTTDLPVKLFNTLADNKNALDKGVPSLRILLENKKFKIPRGDARSVELTDAWRAEMQSITFDKGKVVSVGDHDDMVMAAWICDQAIRTGGFSFDFGADEDSPSESLEELLEAQMSKSNESEDPFAFERNKDLDPEFGLTPEEQAANAGETGNLVADDSELGLYDNPLGFPMGSLGQWF